MSVSFDKAKLDNIDGKLWLSLRLTKESLFDARKMVVAMKDDKTYTADVRRFYNKRSIDANAYAWVLCDKIAEAIRSTKENIYVEAVRQVGAFVDLHVKDSEFVAARAAWHRNGLGWTTELIEQRSGYITFRAYYGSFIYNTQQMSRLIDWLIEEAQELGIETKTPDEVANMLSLWESKA